MARNGRTKDIYKGTFICIQTLIESSVKGRNSGLGEQDKYFDLWGAK